jgi:hypothetical protein
LIGYVNLYSLHEDEVRNQCTKLKKAQPGAFPLRFPYARWL